MNAQWRALWASEYEQRAAAVWAFLERQYNEEHRAYHNMDHITASLGVFEELCPSTASARDRDICRIALWFHDVFYEIRATNNEWRSAVAAGNTCRTLGRPDLIEPVRAAILATRHALPPDGSIHASFVVDADLSILGSHPKMFNDYEVAIRYEYEHIPKAAFRAGRAAILRGFLARPSIYSTVQFRDVFEAPARENLARSIAKLEGSSASVPA
jgi:predicted metal-dependent HD superfamily phosphohydrolase